MTVSLMAEVLLLAIEPGQGGLLVKPRKLRPALRAATDVEGGRRGGRGALREARRELTDAGLIERGPLRRVRLADRTAAVRRFNTLQRAAATGDFADERDQRLFVLLAGCGVLARRFNRHERRLARRRLGSLIPAPNASAGNMHSQTMTGMALLVAAGFGHFDAGGGGGFGDGGDGGGGGGGFDGSGGGGDSGGGQ